jgi:hypothetical protein
MLEHLCVDLEQESKEALATWVLVQIYTQSSFFCLYFLAILVCNFACDLCCFIVNVYSVKGSVELMLYCFYYGPNQNKVFLSSRKEFPLVVRDEANTKTQLI